MIQLACENLNIWYDGSKLAPIYFGFRIRGRFYTLLQLTRKMQEQGGNYLEIGRFEPSSKMCGCGVIKTKN